MNNAIAIGFRVQCSNGRFVVADDGWTDTYEPAPVEAAKAYRRVAAYMEREPSAPIPSVVEVTRPATPLESGAKELGSLLNSLCQRHGIVLGLTPAQVERQIAKELVELGAKAQ